MKYNFSDSVIQNLILFDWLRAQLTKKKLKKVVYNITDTSSAMNDNYAKELDNLRKLRATLQAVKESTDKILQDVETVYKNNNPQLLQQSKDLDQTINKVIN